MQVTSNDKLAQYIREQEHTWAKVYDTSGALIATYSNVKNTEALVTKILQFLEGFPGNYCFEFKRSDTSPGEVICRVKIHLPETVEAGPMQGVPTEDIEKRINEGIKAGLDNYRRENELKELKDENNRLKTTGGKFSNAIAMAFDLWFEHRGSQILGGILGQPGAALNGTPEQHNTAMAEEQEYKSFQELEAEDQERVLTGINYILAHLSPEEIMLLGAKVHQQPEMLPFVRNFLKA